MKRSEVPKKYEPYIRVSMQHVLIPFREKWEQRVEDCKEALTEEWRFEGERGEEYRENWLDFLFNAEKSIRYADEQMTNTDKFVDESLCNEDHFYIDMDAFYKDCIDRNLDKIEGFESLKSIEKRPEHIKKINGWINDLTKINRNILNKTSKQKRLSKVMELAKSL